MKRVLITEKNSYIDTSLENRLMKEPDKYYIDTVSTRDDAWKEKNFSIMSAVCFI